MSNIYDFVDIFVNKFEMCMAIINCKRTPLFYKRYGLLVKNDLSTVKLTCKEYKDYIIIFRIKDNKVPNIKAKQIYPREVIQNGIKSYVFDCKKYNDKSSSIYSPYIMRVGHNNELSFIHKRAPVIDNKEVEDKFYDIIEVEE